MCLTLGPLIYLNVNTALQHTVIFFSDLDRQTNILVWALTTHLLSKRPSFCRLLHIKFLEKKF